MYLKQTTVRLSDVGRSGEGKVVRQLVNRKFLLTFPIDIFDNTSQSKRDNRGLIVPFDATLKDVLHS